MLVQSCAHDFRGPTLPCFAHKCTHPVNGIHSSSLCFRFLTPVEKAEDIHKVTKHMAKHGWHDHDCDGIPDHLDPDDDNDGFFDNKQVSDPVINLPKFPF